ncbi:MAG TPA: cyclase family protein [Candidatus Thermoplasmatota archaeon]|nr:cyclase family protein [Candidatus Thermoplasmatota archaeon]
MLLDISQPVTAQNAVFPGDVPFSCGWTATKQDGSSVNLGWQKGTPHVGTHVDAPYHYDAGGARVGGLDLAAFVGRAVVVDAVGRASIDVDAFRGLDLAAAPRVLLKTARRSDPHAFRTDFPVLTMDAVAHMRAAGVRLVGIDAPSFDAVDSKTLDVHHALGRAGIANVENLVLDRTDAGTYEFLGAPVAWVEMDAAPLRALLRR